MNAIQKNLYFVLLWGIFVLAFLHKLKVLNQSPNNDAINSRLLLEQEVKSEISSASLTQNLNQLLNLEPTVDKRPKLSEFSMIEQIGERFSSLPIVYWNKYKNKAMFYKKEDCAKFPSIYELEFNNIYWQTLHWSNGTFYLYGAYYDVRKLTRIGPAVRILGMLNQIEPKSVSYCQFWFENEKEPVINKVSEYKYLWNKKCSDEQGIFRPFLITCQLPASHHKRVPTSVSLVENICDTSTNNLRVIYNRPVKKKRFCVCVKGLDFINDDLSVRLIEWIELLGILGADKIYFYELEVHPNISRVLNHYKSKGKVHVTPLTLPGGQPNLPVFQHLYLTKNVYYKRQNELIPYNDCLYKNLYMYEYVALLDIDEVIMPLKRRTWGELMDDVTVKALKIKNETQASYNVRNVYFFDDFIHPHGPFKDIPKYMHMSQHVYRSKKFTEPNQYVKCFHNPERVLTLHNHFPLACLSVNCTSHAIETTDAQLQHYRADCVDSLKNCAEYRSNSVADASIWRYKQELIAKTVETLKILGFFGVVA